MNKIGYAVQRMIFAVLAMGRRKEETFLAMESIAIWDSRETKWLQSFCDTGNPVLDAVIQALIVGLVGAAITNLILTAAEELLMVCRLFL